MTKESFEKWYSSQSEYQKFEDRAPDEQERLLNSHRDDLLGKVLREKYGVKEAAPRKHTQWCTVKDAMQILNIGDSAILRLIKSGKLRARKENNSWLILTDDITWLKRYL